MNINLYDLYQYIIENFHTNLFGTGCSWRVYACGVWKCKQLQGTIYEF